jgi:hypothetical protein
MKIEDHLVEDKGHCSTKDHSFHYEKEDLSMIIGEFEHQMIDKRENVPHSTGEHKDQEEDALTKTKSIKKQKHRHQISKCGHEDMPYYANGMCQNCYHAKGRTKKATKCEHSDRPLYAKGICKNCYLSIYHKKKRSELKTSSSNVSSDSATILTAYQENISTTTSPKNESLSEVNSPKN